MATAPAYAATLRCGMGQATTANVNRDGTGTLATVFTAGASGSRIDKIKVSAVGNTSAGVVRLFIFDGGTTTRLYDEIIVTPVTPSTSTAAWEYEIELTYPILLPASHVLKASTHIGTSATTTDLFNVFAFGGDF